MTTKKERAEALARMTKAELVKTVMTLDGRQVKLLNRIAALETAEASRVVNTSAPTVAGSPALHMQMIGRGQRRPNATTAAAMAQMGAPDGGSSLSSANARASAGRMPWETALAATTDYAASSGAPIKRGE